MGSRNENDLRPRTPDKLNNELLGERQQFKGERLIKERKLFKQWGLHSIGFEIASFERCAQNSRGVFSGRADGYVKWPIVGRESS